MSEKAASIYISPLSLHQPCDITTFVNIIFARIYMRKRDVQPPFQSMDLRKCHFQVHINILGAIVFARVRVLITW